MCLGHEKMTLNITDPHMMCSASAKLRGQLMIAMWLSRLGMGWFRILQ